MGAYEPDSFKEMDEIEKQDALYDELWSLHDRFVTEYDISEISFTGTVHRFLSSVTLNHEFGDEDEELG